MTSIVANAVTNIASPPATHGCRSGFSLLEVLVACGILIFALSGIAAILPAAGSLLAESVAQDRSSMLASNVLAELSSRGLLRADAILTGANPFAIAIGSLGNSTTWLTGTDPAFKDARACLITPLVTGSGGSAFDRAWPYGLNKSAPQDDQRGFFIEDDLVSTATGAGVTLAYEAGDPALGTAVGPRRFKRGVSWLATIATATNAPLPPTPGAVATLSIATLKKPGDVAAIELFKVATGTNMFFLPPGNQTVVKSCLSPGSSFLALPPPSTASSGPRPTWFRVASSWTTLSGTSFIVVHNNTVPLDSFETSGPPKLIEAIGFAGLLRLEQFPVTLK